MNFLNKIFTFKKVHFLVVTYKEWERHIDTMKLYMSRGTKVNKGELVMFCRISQDETQMDKYAIREITSKRFALGRQSLVTLKKISWWERRKAHWSRYVEGEHRGIPVLSDRAGKRASKRVG